MRKTTFAAIAVAAATSLALTATAVARWSDPASPIAEMEGGVAAASLDDPTIVAIFDAANTADIETGELAAARGHSKQVRDFGAMIARDHRAVRQMGRDLAKRLAITPTPPSEDAGAKAHASAMVTLRSLNGAEFDRAFLRHEVAFHKAVLDAVQTTLLPAIENDELEKLVTEVAPAFQGHMVAAQSLEKQLTGSGTGN